MSGPVTPAQKSVLMMFAGAVTGAVGKRFIDTAISKQTAITLSDTMKKGINLGEFVGGGVLAYAMKNPFLQGLGIGLAVEGGTGLLAQMNVITGVGEARIPMVNFNKQLGRPNPNFSGATKTPSVGNVYNFPSPPNVGKARRRDGM
jgi:hypothetical protein